MNSFQNTILIIAIIVFVIIIIFMGLVIANSHNTQVWPPLIGSCPDYWVDIEGDGAKCVNMQDLGTCTDTSNQYENHSYMNFNQAPFNGSNGNCAKNQWATGCDVTWDGITYGVASPCDTE
jgi:hypothetical protein